MLSGPSVRKVSGECCIIRSIRGGFVSHIEDCEHGSQVSSSDDGCGNKLLVDGGRVVGVLQGLDMEWRMRRDLGGDFRCIEKGYAYLRRGGRPTTVEAIGGLGRSGDGIHITMRIGSPLKTQRIIGGRHVMSLSIGIYKMQFRKWARAFELNQFTTYRAVVRRWSSI